MPPTPTVRIAIPQTPFSSFQFAEGLKLAIAATVNKEAQSVEFVPGDSVRVEFVKEGRRIVDGNAGARFVQFLLFLILSFLLLKFHNFITSPLPHPSYAL